MSNPRNLSEQEKQEILSLKNEDFTLDLLKGYFAYRGNPPKNRFNTNDKVELKKNELFNDNDITTTIGRVIFNKFILKDDMMKLLGFQNYTLRADDFGSLDKKIIDLFLNEKITIERLYQYFDDINWLAYAPTYFIVPSLNMDMYILPDNIKKLKANLEKEYADAILNGDVIKFSEMEKKLLDAAKQEVSNYAGYMIYDSGARGSFGNNYKNSVLMRGGIKNFTNPNEFYISLDSLVDGIGKQDFDKFANILTAGTFARAKNTQKGGYISKQLQSAFQHMVIDVKGSDCGSKQLLNITLNKDTAKLFNYRYIIENGKEKILTPDNIKSYIGKPVKMRSPIYCIGNKFCNKCVGDLFYRMGLENVGLVANKTGSTLMQYSLKQFHDSSIKITEIDYEQYITKL